MNEFAAYEYGGPHDGMLCVFGRGFRVKDFTDIRLAVLEGKRAAEFTFTGEAGDVHTYRTRYPALVQAARKSAQGVA